MGLLLIALGIVGFLPVLGFWMIPLGLALLATDVPPLRRWFTRWLNTHRRKHHPKLKRVLEREPPPGPPY